jgi:hypothetical protein
MSDRLPADELIERIPPVCTLEETCEILRMSRRNADRLRKLGAFPVPEMQPPFDDRPRFSGEDILAAIRARWLRPTT